MSLESLAYKETTTHLPVMAAEVLEMLKVQPDGCYIDATAGGGGHSAVIGSALGRHGRLIAVDRDPDVNAKLRNRFAGQKPFAMQFVNDTFSHFAKLLAAEATANVDGILFDLGLSSDQLDNPARGFSFDTDGPLDMRMNQTQRKTARSILEQANVKELTAIFKNYGDEMRAARLARILVERRQQQPLTTTFALRDVIVSALKPKQPVQRIKTLARNFMALRIAVNDELQELSNSLEAAVTLLKPGGRLVLLSYHSGEDRLVKQFFRRESRDCLCPTTQLYCTCNHRARLSLLTKKPLKPTVEECQQNSRSRSACLRAATRTGA